MKAETEVKVKFGGWGVVCGAVIAMVIGFAWGGWSTAGTTDEMIEEAVIASQAEICAAQFMKELNHKEQLKELGKIENSWNRSEYIEKGGWDKMPGQKEADNGVARACAEGLEILFEK